MTTGVGIDAKPRTRKPRLAVHFSGRTDEWATPENFFDSLDAEFDFTLDVCASVSNAKCARFITRSQDGLAQSWAGERCWMNPPYGREIKAWMQKAYESSASALVVGLVPARTDTAWWHDYAARAAEIRFVRGRLRFGEAMQAARSRARSSFFDLTSLGGWSVPLAVVILEQMLDVLHERSVYWKVSRCVDAARKGG